MGNCLMGKKGEIGIDILPPEVLELVFKELSTLNDIQSCYNTSRRWRTIITKMFKEKGEQSQDTFSMNHVIGSNHLQLS